MKKKVVITVDIIAWTLEMYIEHKKDIIQFVVKWYFNWCIEWETEKTNSIVAIRGICAHGLHKGELIL